MFKNRVLITLCAVAFAISVTSISAFASTTNVKNEKTTPKKLSPAYQSIIKASKEAAKKNGGIEKFEAIKKVGNVEKLTVGSVMVNVVSPCDEEWRANYPSTWAWQANNAIEVSDDQLQSRSINIDFRSTSQKLWDSNDNCTYIEDMLDEAMSEYSLGTNDLMVAFTGQDFGGDVGYTFDFGDNYCISVDCSSTSYNAEVTLHELGHCYDLHHISGDNDCVMTAVDLGHLDEMCSTHETQWENNESLH